MSSSMHKMTRRETNFADTGGNAGPTTNERVPPWTQAQWQGTPTKTGLDAAVIWRTSCLIEQDVSWVDTNGKKHDLRQEQTMEVEEDG